MKKHLELNIKMLTGTDSGITKKAYFEDTHKTLEPCNVFTFSPVIGSGVDFTIPMQECSEQLAKSFLTDDREV